MSRIARVSHTNRPPWTRSGLPASATRRRSLSSLPVIMAQEPAEAGPTEKSALLLTDGRPRVDQGATEALVVPLSVVVLDVLSNRVADGGALRPGSPCDRGTRA